MTKVAKLVIKKWDYITVGCILIGFAIIMYNNITNIGIC